KTLAEIRSHSEYKRSVGPSNRNEPVPTKEIKDTRGRIGFWEEPPSIRDGRGDIVQSHLNLVVAVDPLEIETRRTSRQVDLIDAWLQRERAKWRRPRGADRRPKVDAPLRWCENKRSKRSWVCK